MWFTGIEQEIEIWPHEQMVYAQPKVCPGEWDTQNPLGFWDTNWSPNFGQTTRLSCNQQEKENLQNCVLAFPVDHRVKLKENEKRDKYVDLTRELKQLRNMKVTVILAVIGALGTVTKGLVQRLVQGMEDLEIRGRVETIQTTALLRTTRILRRVLETWGDLLSLKLQWKTIG